MPLDQLSLIEAVHFLAFISIGALPRGTAPRDCPEALGYLLMSSMALALLDAARAATTCSPAAVAALTLPPAT